MAFDLGHGVGLGHLHRHEVITNTTVATVVLSPSSVALSAGSPTKQLTFVAKNAQGQILPGKTFTFTSSAPAVATVSAGGLVTRVAPGSTTLTATCSAVTSIAVTTTVS